MTMGEEVMDHGEVSEGQGRQEVLTRAEARADFWARLALSLACAIFIAVVVWE